MPLLEIDGLRVEFPSRQGPLAAVDGVSLHVDAGEVVGVVGESGAGKSLTGAAVIGLIAPPGRVAGGEIRFEGRRIDSLPEDEMRRVRGRRIGAVFQDPLTSLNPLHTVGRMLVETMRAHSDLGADAARRRAAGLLAEVGLPDPERRLRAYPHELSGGMRQRVVVALALCAGPRLVVADEPTTALDVSVQAQIVALLKKLCRDRGMAVLLITHDMGVVAEAADRVVVMYAGRVAEAGPTRTVVGAPRHPYAKGLVAAIPRVGGAAGRLAQIDGAMPRLGAFPAGCAFHPRCPEAFGRCRRERPGLAGAGDGVRSACWLVAGDARER